MTDVMFDPVIIRILNDSDFLDRLAKIKGCFEEVQKALGAFLEK